MTGHLPALLDETLDALAPRAGGCYVDGTLGLGGHTRALLERIGPDGQVIGLDRDAEMLERARGQLAEFGPRFRGVHARLSALGDVVRGAGADPVDGILLDLGLCSAQLDDPERGLSFAERARDHLLDMRMDRSRGETAAQLLSRLGEEELQAALREGDVPAPRRVARALHEHRPVRTVGDLLDALGSVKLPRRRHHPATLVFQALRMAVNDEAQELDSALESGVELLASGGRLAVISYHSGEDRRVKNFMAREVRGCICPPALPACGCGRVPRLRHVVRGQGASDAEIRRNPRARSARLRAGERL